MKNLLFLFFLSTFAAKAQSDFMVFDLENGKKDTLYTTVDTPPIVKGDEPAFYEAFLAELNFNPALRERKVEATVPLMFTVTKQGKVKDIDLVESSKLLAYDREVLTKAKAFFTARYTFSPAKAKNKTVNAVYSLDVTFKPNKKIGNLKNEGGFIINASIDTIFVKNLQNNSIYKRIVTKPDSTNISTNVTSGTTISNNTVYQVVDEQAAFPGGTVELGRYLSSNIKYPAEARENGIQGRVVLKFVVSEEGELKGISVLKSIDSLLDTEAIRVTEKMPKWTPGKIGGIPVKSYFTMPVSFKLEG